MAPWRLNQVAGPTGCPVHPLNAEHTIAPRESCRKLWGIGPGADSLSGILAGMETVPTLDSVRRDALRLSQDERELLALDLALSVEKEPGYAEAWAAEIERRLKEVDEGEAGLMDWEDAKRYIFGNEDEPDSKAG